MARKPNKNAKYFTLRLHNDDTIKLLNEIVDKLKDNRNAILNEALDIGVPLLYERYFQNKVKTAAAANDDSAVRSRSVVRQLEEIRQTMEDLFIEMNVQETMLAGLFNVKGLELDGVSLTGQALREGNVCDLPELVAGIKDDMTTTHGGKQ